MFRALPVCTHIAFREGGNRPHEVLGYRNGMMGQRMPWVPSTLSEGRRNKSGVSRDPVPYLPGEKAGVPQATLVC